MSQPPPPPPSSPPRTLAISLAVSLLFISSAILLVTATTAFMLCYCRRRRDRPGSESGHRVPGTTPSGGTDAAAAIRSVPGVETTLPAFSYTPQEGEHGGSALECAVCLGAVKEGEMVRQLPACMHVYHVGCIDRWLAAHQTCPVCRSIAA
ncbi:unnamed protein product [Miscanthus lutarioriparius]|uniref:RING-type E3 ubiquitin transferase n=1 Tax=Miscanthus lutarioriparius TaxID=422564 RepID=A0A811S9M4_9POAL|nr:unnamed protein product [Miscanthus lutarioriparius]